jgi:hypothetical protein
MLALGRGLKKSAQMRPGMLYFGDRVRRTGCSRSAIRIQRENRSSSMERQQVKVCRDMMFAAKVEFHQGLWQWSKRDRV